MDKNRKLVIEYIKNNCENYKNFFYNRDINKLMKYSTNILERKLLNINHFCYFLNYCITYALKNPHIYLRLSKGNRYNYDFYHKSVIKIYMHIDSIFGEIDKIKKYINK